MLKSLNEPRLGPASPSPRFHLQSRHVSLSPRTATETARRKSYISDTSPIPAPAPPRQVVQYVSRGTQYSPQKMDEIRPDPTLSATGLPQRSEPLPQTTVVPSTTIPPSPTKPTSKPESPGIKRRQSLSADLSITSRSEELTPKRPKPAPAAVKILPAKYEECAVEDLAILIASMISELIQTNDALPRPNPVLTRFHSRTPPGISVLDYLQRLAKHATLTPPLLLSMVYYIDRLCALYPDFTVTTLTIHRFLITAATVAAKGLSDSFWNNSTYARVGGIKITELGLLELEFLYRVDWKIVPNPEVLVDYYKGLIDRTPGFILEGDSSSDEDDEEDSDMVDSPPSGGPGTETAARWQAWMDENKNVNNGKFVGNEEGLSPTSDSRPPTKREE